MHMYMYEDYSKAIITAAFVDDILSLVLFNILFSLGGEWQPRMRESHSKDPRKAWKRCQRSPIFPRKPLKSLKKP